jgi:hypothetical protein
VRSRADARLMLDRATVLRLHLADAGVEPLPKADTLMCGQCFCRCPHRRAYVATYIRIFHAHTYASMGIHFAGSSAVPLRNDHRGHSQRTPHTCLLVVHGSTHTHTSCTYGRFVACVRCPGGASDSQCRWTNGGSTVGGFVMAFQPAVTSPHSSRCADAASHAQLMVHGARLRPILHQSQVFLVTVRWHTLCTVRRPHTGPSNQGLGAREGDAVQHLSPPQAALELRYTRYVIPRVLLDVRYLRGPRLPTHIP